MGDNSPWARKESDTTDRLSTMSSSSLPCEAFLQSLTQGALYEPPRQETIAAFI